jgi:hypothetical protein
MMSMKTPTGKFLTSIIWGLGIAALFYLATKEVGITVTTPEEFASGAFIATPEIDGGCGHYRHHGYPSHELPCDSAMQPTQPALTGFDAPLADYKVSDCKNCHNFEHPHCLWNEHIRPENCGDSRHYRKAGCYKHHPMDSIFRAPSSQIYLHQTRN